MDAREAIERALNATGPVVADVERSSYGAGTPCSEWNVRQLLQHLLADAAKLASRLTGVDPGFVAPPGGLPDRDLIGDDHAAAFKRSADALRAAARDEAALEREGLTTGALTTDLYVHGWDLARATARPIVEDDELAAYLLAFVQRGITEQNRSPAFGPPLAVATDATPTDHLVAFLGRNPDS